MTSRKNCISFTAQQLLQRGFGLLYFDGPGMGEPLRVHGIRAQLTPADES
jgi:hypothetical protein